MFNVFTLFAPSPFTYLHGDVSILAEKLASGQVNPNYVEPYNRSLLYGAISHYKPQAVVCLLRYGANPNLPLYRSGERICLVDNWSNPALRKLLLSYGADYECLRQEYPDSARVKWLDSIKEMCYSADGFYRQGKEYVLKGQYQNAKACFEKAVNYFNQLIKDEEENRNVPYVDARTKQEKVFRYKIEPAYLEDYNFRKKNSQDYIVWCNEQLGIDSTSLESHTTIQSNSPHQSRPMSPPVRG